MNLDSLLPYHGHNLLAAAGVLAGLSLLFLVFKVKQLGTKLLLLVVAAAFFAGAYWWVTQIRS